MPPAADPPPGHRLALVVATSIYADPGLRRLRAPAEDADDLAQVLADPGIGGFARPPPNRPTAPPIPPAPPDFLAGRRPGGPPPGSLSRPRPPGGPRGPCLSPPATPPG